MVNVAPGDPVPNGVDADQTDLFVYGLGRSGTAVVKRARRQGLEVAFYDARAEGPDVDEALAAGATRVGDVSQLMADAFPTCVAAPGVSIDHPDLTSLRQRGVHVTGEVEAPGSWEGIWMNGGGLLANHLEIAHAGDNRGLVIEGAITFSSLDLPSCTHLTNTTIRSSASNGVHIEEQHEPFVRLDAMLYEDIALENQVGQANGPDILGGATCI